MYVYVQQENVAVIILIGKDVGLIETMLPDLKNGSLIILIKTLHHYIRMYVSGLLRCSQIDYLSHFLCM